MHQNQKRQRGRGSDRKKPLYRKVNTRTRGVHHDYGGDFRHDRNTKVEKRNPASRGTMHGSKQRGLDYTPLFRFLLSKVGQDWDEVYAEAKARLDRDEPVFWMVARTQAEHAPFVRLGQSSYFSGLYVDGDNRLALVDPDLGVDDMVPSCPCCTHTFNGERFTQAFDDPAQSVDDEGLG